MFIKGRRSRIIKLSNKAANTINIVIFIVLIFSNEYKKLKTLNIKQKKTYSFKLNMQYNKIKPKWAQQKQSSPPFFGKAIRVPNFILNLIILMRKKKLENYYSFESVYNNKVDNFISIVILTCKRVNTLERLLKSLKLYLQKIETYKNFEIILVDNGTNINEIEEISNDKIFSKYIRFEENIGMLNALKIAYNSCKGEFIMLIEDDFILDYEKPFFQKCIEIFKNKKEIGIIRLKNQNNWFKRSRIISYKKKILSNLYFWYWLPSIDKKKNVWAAGSVIFRKASLEYLGGLPTFKNLPRNDKNHQGIIYEYKFGKKFNKLFLAAKIENCYPFFQPNDNEVSPGWNDLYEPQK